MGNILEKGNYNQCFLNVVTPLSKNQFFFFSPLLFRRFLAKEKKNQLQCLNMPTVVVVVKCFELEILDERKQQI
jgi:hypothetical protein